MVDFGDPAVPDSGDSRNRNLLPAAIQLSAGDTVRFRVTGFHQIGVYKVAAATTRQAVTANPDAFVDTKVNSPLSDNDIGDAKNRVALGTSPRQIDTAAVTRDSALDMDLTLTQPGRYLVLCAIRSHFLDKKPEANGGMFGFVDVVQLVEGASAIGLTGPVGYPADATVRFGDPRFRGRGDERNYNLLPAEITVKAGATVRFDVAGVHEVAVYKAPPGTTRQAVISNRNAFVNTAINSPYSELAIGDPKNRIALGASFRPFDTAAVRREDGLSMNLTITQPGRYLVICAIRSHFTSTDPGANGGMFGFINVR